MNECYLQKCDWKEWMNVMYRSMIERNELMLFTQVWLKGMNEFYVQKYDWNECYVQKYDWKEWMTVIYRSMIDRNEWMFCTEVW